ncbi:Cytochrome P450 82C2 [Folsomia candida]|uniref:Cytochrome P450 82C2 n=1 Tax=Folsomia candida TaxID=158441 RepID=A0A226DC75_FOLCA|nr:Cytochrome P450 82C2 [Folsomia candida]
MSSEIKKYSVVNFHDENTVAAVCSSWLNEDKSICSWPIGPNAGDKLRKNLPADLDAPKFPCQWLMSYNSLKSARKGCIAAKSTDKIPPSEFEETTHKKQRNTRKGQSAAKSTPSTKYSESTSSDESSLSSEECETLPVTSFIPTTPSISLSTNSQVQPLSALPQSHNSSQAEENLFDQSGNNETTFSYVEITNPETVAELVTLVRDLKTESQNLQAVVVKELVKINETLVELLRRTSTLAPRVPSLPSWIIQNYRFSIQLGYVGGRDLDDIIARLLSGLISTELAQTCSHSGKGKKSEFGLVGVFLDLVYRSVRHNSAEASTTNATIDVKIRTWLKNQKDPRKIANKTCPTSRNVQDSGQDNGTE